MGRPKKEKTMPIRLSHSVWLWLKREALNRWEETGKYTTPDAIVRKLIIDSGGMLYAVQEEDADRAP
jgi:hypothetical protein